MNKLKNFNASNRSAILRELTSTSYDLIVIGGGVTGASIFRDAALRGMHVVLVDANDFTSATSSRSSKLIHGGLRYLKYGGFRLARESCLERNLHLKLNSRLVHPIPFLIPVYRKRRPSKFTLAIGMWLYDLLSNFRNYRLHRFLNARETHDLIPGINTRNLLGSFEYHDAVVDDSRWTIEIIKDGVRHGGIAVNYAPVQGLVKADESITGVHIIDRRSGKLFLVKASAVINATGIFADHVRRMDDERAKPLIQLSQGTHIVFSEKDVPAGVTLAFASAVDRKDIFLAKQDGCFLLGTTDNWVQANPDNPIPREEEIEYLLESVRDILPDAQLDRRKIQYVYSGFRPLLHLSTGSHSSAATREECLEVSRSGLITIVGGKLTTARIMAIRVLRKVLSQIRRNPSWLQCQTHKIAIGGSAAEYVMRLESWSRKYPKLAEHFRFFYSRYGTDADELCRTESGYFLKGSTAADAAMIAEILYACRYEMVCTLTDIMERRIGRLHWSVSDRLAVVQKYRQTLCKGLRLTDKTFRAERARYKKYLNAFHCL